MRKIALDADPGVADAVTLAFALFDPNVEIVAATSVGGCVDSRTSARNLQSLVAFLDPPRLPRVGVGDEPSVPPQISKSARPFKSAQPFQSSQLSQPSQPPQLSRSSQSTQSFGATGRRVPAEENRDVFPIIKDGVENERDEPFFDDFGGFALPVVELRAPHSAATILRDAVRSHPRETSILALGPLTNVARAFRRDPELPLLVDRLVVAGGGRPSAARTTTAEFNVFCDPQAARFVFQSPCAKTFVPVDAASELVFSFEDLTALDPRGAVVGEFLRSALLDALRFRRRSLGSEVVCLQEFAAYFALVEPRFFSTVDAESLDEICGAAPRDVEFDLDFESPFELASRPPRRRRRDVEIVRKIDADAVRGKIVDGLRRIVDATRRRDAR